MALPSIMATANGVNGITNGRTFGTMRAASSGRNSPGQYRTPNDAVTHYCITAPPLHAYQINVAASSQTSGARQWNGKCVVHLNTGTVTNKQCTPTERKGNSKYNNKDENNKELEQPIQTPKPFFQRMYTPWTDNNNFIQQYISQYRHVSTGSPLPMNNRSSINGTDAHSTAFDWMSSPPSPSRQNVNIINTQEWTMRRVSIHWGCHWDNSLMLCHLSQWLFSMSSAAQTCLHTSSACLVSHVKSLTDTFHT